MSFQEKNITVRVINFTLILVFYLFRLFQLISSGSFTPANVFWLWGTVILLAVVVTIVATILTHIGSGILEGIRTREEPKVHDIEDERDKLIDLRGTRVAYGMTSLGAFLSMLTFVLGQPPLVMFSALVLVGVLAEVVGSLTRLYLYRRGF